MNTTDINLLLAKYLSGSAQGSEEQQVENWIELHKEEYLNLKVLWADSTAAPVSDALFAPEEGWLDVLPHLCQQQPEITMRGSGRFKFLAIAAGLVLTLGLGLLFYLSTPITIQTAQNEVRSIILDDGSIVTLDGNTTLAYSRNFRSERSIYLKGQAFFEVKRDSLHPFTVKAGNLNVEVLGTSFLVHNKSALQRVIVKTGKVSISEVAGYQKEVLLPNEAIDYEAGTLTRYINNETNFLAWKTKELVFVNVRLSEVFHTLEKYYKVKIIMENTSPAGCEVSTVFKQQSLQEVLQELSMHFKFTFKQEGDNIIVAGISCNGA